MNEWQWVLLGNISGMVSVEHSFFGNLAKPLESVLPFVNAVEPQEESLSRHSGANTSPPRLSC